MAGAPADKDDLVRHDDVLAAVEVVAEMLSKLPEDAAWGNSAGQLEWTCRDTLAHMVDCLNWYAANLARRSTGDVEIPEVAETMAPPQLVDALRSGGAVLAAAVAAAGVDDRAWHPFGIADRSGFAAMGCDEVLVHGFDLAAGLGKRYEPPSELAERVVRRLFPWSPEGEDAWATLLWANGRVALGDRRPETQWLWQCAPLAEWNGEVRRWRPKPPPDA